MVRSLKWVSTGMKTAFDTGKTVEMSLIPLPGTATDMPHWWTREGADSPRKVR